MVFSIHLLESVDVESQLYALFCTISYKDLDHPQVLVSTGGLGTNPPVDTEGLL